MKTGGGLNWVRIFQIVEFSIKNDEPSDSATIVLVSTGNRTYFMAGKYSSLMFIIVSESF